MSHDLHGRFVSLRNKGSASRRSHHDDVTVTIFLNLNRDPRGGVILDLDMITLTSRSLPRRRDVRTRSPGRTTFRPQVPECPFSLTRPPLCTKSSPFLLSDQTMEILETESLYVSTVDGLTSPHPSH